jgi:hypothetical protein
VVSNGRGGRVFDWEEPWRGRRSGEGDGGRGRREEAWFCPRMVRDDEVYGAIRSGRFSSAAVTSPRVYYSRPPALLCGTDSSGHRQLSTKTQKRKKNVL